MVKYTGRANGLNAVWLVYGRHSYDGYMGVPDDGATTVVSKALLSTCVDDSATSVTRGD